MSVSVGNPAIRSAPIAIPGRAARAAAITACGVAVRCRRFIRFRIRSLPACNERWRCGIRRGSSSISRHRSSSIHAGSSDDSRRRGNSGTSASSGRPIGPAPAGPAGRARRRRYRHRSAPPRETRSPPASRTCRTTAPIGTERFGPRPNGMTQKVQRWSHPAAPERRRASARNSVRGAPPFPAPLDVVTRVPASPPTFRRSFSGCRGRDDAGQRRPGVRLDLGRATGDDDAGSGRSRSIAGSPAGPDVRPPPSPRTC